MWVKAAGTVAAAVALSFVAAATGCSGPPRGNQLSVAVASQSPSPAPTTTAAPAPELPRGGRVVFPAYRVVAFYGAADTPALGVLGQDDPDNAALRLAKQAQAYAGLGRPVMPAFELIATEASYARGDGAYSMPSSDETIVRYLAAARRAKALLVLDIQPGRAEFLPEVKRYEKFLVQPDVGLALDPEWKMAADQIPARVLGHTDAETINNVSAYLADIVARYGLPQKLFVVHQFTSDMIANRQRVVPRKGLAITFHMDGFGSRAVKLAVYHATCGSNRYFNGIKLFYNQDVDMLSAREAAALRPSPNLITYQ